MSSQYIHTDATIALEVGYLRGAVQLKAAIPKESESSRVFGQFRMAAKHC